ADSLGNVGVLQYVLGRAEQAQEHHQEALTLRRRLFPAARFPDGHKGLADRARPVLALARSSATVANGSATLPRARYAHLGTHGFSDSERFHQEEQRRSRWRAGTDTGVAPTVAGQNNPLAYVGLLLAGAEVPTHAGPGGSKLTGAEVAGLDLGG